MNERQARLLEAIIDQFIQTALPVGSKRLLETAGFSVSPATIRSEMAFLEEEGFLTQPHVSAGRIPTAKGYRMYVQQFMEPSREQKSVQKRFNTLKEQYLIQKDRERVYDAVALLASMMPNVSFATVPHRERVYYLGLANVLKQPEFVENPKMASSVVEVLESNLTNLLSEVEVDEKTRYYIGEENLLPQIQSCGILVKEYAIRGEKGAIGILGPLRMDYAYNTVALDLVSDFLRD